MISFVWINYRNLKLIVFLLFIEINMVVYDDKVVFIDGNEDFKNSRV